MPLPIANPYHDSQPNTTLIKVVARVSPQDQALFERTFPFSHGLQDRIVATLYHELARKLRSELNVPSDSYSPPDSAVAWHIDHPSWSLLRRLLGGASGQPDDGADGPRDDTGAAGSIHQGVRAETPERSSAADDVAQGSVGPGSEEGVEKEKVKRGPGDGPAKPARRGKTLMDLLEQLKEGLAE